MSPVTSPGAVAMVSSASGRGACGQKGGGGGLIQYGVGRITAVVSASPWTSNLI